MKTVFLDRDGVINEYPGDGDYVKSWQEFRFLPGIIDALKALSENGYKIFVISNQAGVGKGIYSQENLDRITSNMLAELKRRGIHLEGVYYCIHRQEDNCLCRKPKTGLVDQIMRDFVCGELHQGRAHAYFIGDTILDIKTGKAAGLKTILVFSGKEKPKNKKNWEIIPDFTARDLSAAVELILKLGDASEKRPQVS